VLERRLTFSFHALHVHMSANGHLADIATVAGGNDGIVAALRPDRPRSDRARCPSEPACKIVAVALLSPLASAIRSPPDSGVGVGLSFGAAIFRYPTMFRAGAGRRALFFASTMAS
jgi:hypothetical protein